MHCRLRNFATMLNKTKKKMYYHKIISNSSIDSKTMWNVINQLMGKSGGSTPSLVAEENFSTKPDEIANYLSVYFSDKIQKLNDVMKVENKCLELSSRLITNKLKNKCCSFHFEKGKASTAE